MKISKELKIGLFAAIALAFLYFGYNFLRGKRLFGNSKTYYVVYGNISGVVKSTPIYYKGLKVGMIDKLELIKLRDENKILATLVIDDEIIISKSSEAKIISQDLLGGKSISMIVPDLKEPLAEGDTVLGTDETSLTASISELMTPIKEKTENVMVSLNNVLIEIHKVMKNKGTDNLSAGIGDLSETLKNLNSASTTLNNMLKSESVKISKVLANFESISSNINANNSNINSSLGNIKKLTDSLSQAPLKSTIEQLNRTSQQLAIITQKLNSGEGSAGKLINDKQLYDNLNQSTFELQALLKDMREYPGRYVNVSVFGGGAKSADKKREADLKKQSKMSK